MNIQSYTKKYIPILSIGFGIVVGWMTFPIEIAFPMVAVFILFVGLSTGIFFLKNRKNWIDYVLYIAITTLSFFLVFRANEFLQLLNVLVIIVSISLLARSIDTISNFAYLVFSPFTVLFNTIQSKNDYPFIFAPKTIIKKSHLKSSLFTLLLTVAVLLIILPLLASANPIFQNLLLTIGNIFDVPILKKIIGAESFSTYILRIGATVIFIFLIPRAFSVVKNGTRELFVIRAVPINFLIPKIVLSGVLAVFFVTQMQLYGASPEVLQGLGYTNARLTNEVFIQVTLVSFIVLLLTYFDKKKTKWNTLFTYVLILEALFLIGVAFKSVYDYSILFGFTQKRLWGYASMTWLFGAIALYVYHYYKETAFQWFVKYMVTFTLCVVVVINFLNFDLLIYQSEMKKEIDEIDYRYLSSISADAHHYATVLPQLIHTIDRGSNRDLENVYPALDMVQSIKQLRVKYADTGNINSFNLAEYQEYIATKDLDIATYEKELLNLQHLLFMRDIQNSRSSSIEK